MALAITLTPAVVKQFQPITCSVTGGVASTKYNMTMAHPGGGTFTGQITTDGSGNWSGTWPCQEKGTFTMTVTPIGQGAVSATATGS